MANKFLLKKTNNQKCHSIINEKYIEVGDQTVEGDFNNYGMNSNIYIDLNKELINRSFVVKNPVIYEKGRVFRLRVDGSMIKNMEDSNSEGKVDVTPILNSFSNGEVTVSASSTASGYPVYNAFNDSSKYWKANSVNTSITMIFKKPIVLTRYSISKYYNGPGPNYSSFAGSNDGRTWTTFVNKTSLSSNFNNNTAYTHYRFSLSGHTNASENYHTVNRIYIYRRFYQKLLIFQDSQYKFYDNINNEWGIIGNTCEEADFLNHGTLPSSIPEEAWSKISGEVELLYYREEDVSEMVFSIETEPFTLAEELGGQTIKVIEYTDNPAQHESTITLETEPFTFYDKIGDSFDVLYYTDNPDKTEAELEINHNYSPWDELDGDFELVTWTMEEETEVQEELDSSFKEAIDGGNLYTASIKEDAIKATGG
ncbi:discoidin domain-containing protein [Paenibacillus sp. OSY-SE]|uniref:discoidin domain-containing protein n=1 Tax=Paenibacillus sp. OSY-SE TaxID=1196323 RepID=UPI0002DC8E31|nr:discoidin domain-containing protein [Paenibacillus sp. OSY-SE]